MAQPGLLLRWMGGVPPAAGESVEPFTLGSVGGESEEPFDILWAAVYSESEESFQLAGEAGVYSDEPFNLGDFARANSDEPFNILSPGAGGFLGAGSPASPLLGWRERTS